MGCFAMDLTEWFESPAGKALKASEDPVLAKACAYLHGEVLVWATSMADAGPSHLPCGMKISIRHLLGGIKACETRGARVCGSLASLPYASGSVDAFVLQHGLEIERNPARGVAEIARILRDGGRAFIVSLNPGAHLGMRMLLGKIPRIRLLDPLALDCARLPYPHAVRRYCAREDLRCERQTRVLGSAGSATVTELRKERLANNLLSQPSPQGVQDELPLVGAMSRGVAPALGHKLQDSAGCTHMRSEGRLADKRNNRSAEVH